MRDHKVMRSFERVVDRLRAWFFSLCFGVLVSASSTVSAENTESSFNMTQGVTEISGKVYHLHMLIFYICVAIAVVVFGVMFYSIIKHRKSKGAVAANFHESTKVEIIWTVIPILILIGMAIPATKTLIEMEDTSESDITVKITGSQWKWHYSYFDHDIEFFSYLSTSNEQIEGTDEKGEHYLLEVDNALVLPIGKKIRFLMTSDDVIHSWWVPDFAVKKDTIPGFINEAWTKIDKPGIYRGQCAELCGRNHGFMPIVVQAVEAAEFDEWIANKEQELAAAKLEEQKALEKTLGMDELMALGKDVYEGRCAVCHQSNGLGVANVFPAMKGSAVVLGDVNGHIDIIVNGVSGTAMQAFGTQLTAEEIAAVVTYERNAWDNNTGDVVQASDVSTQMNAEGE
ncbi:cytochrome c oxidase subunit II [Vibrio breoganii]|uniref:Cytochrome c oxidase subunit 2 n=1 Tax=Vibrio breoganii TaxID=553239 RepID=A0ABX1UDE5_9VIBR|nr:cytochrome c oxidase subunit II [Vibrio breoganii]NMR71122.1 cytochrome c oxidase subunit II [Vibrio breoganii]OEF86531.1 cytochrome c oxidase subunit II [Vibrio breoganii 1C10]PMG03643.1 cytochrome c oxidase subunit II [Vibrio breoganii]PML92215.1 cytochrome c oxidase subunit II [Vibrio breoganii]